MEGWICPTGLAEDHALVDAVLAVHADILNGPLAGDPLLNPVLAIESRALRRIENWRVLLLLTPWVLARLLFPDQPPGLALPPDWSAADRTGADYLVLGPQLRFTLLGQVQQAHLSFAPRLGHYLLQPICLDLSVYRNAESVFADWGQVIHTRDENLQQTKRDCPMQQEISRRELFRRLRP